MIFVDSNYEVLRTQSRIESYTKFLHRSLRLSYLLSSGRVIHPGPQFLENPVFREVYPEYRIAFEEGVMQFATKLGVGFAELLAQRESEWNRYPPKLLAQYRDQSVQAEALRLPSPLESRSVSMTKLIDTALERSLQSQDNGSLGYDLGIVSKEGSNTTRLHRWLADVRRWRLEEGAPLMHDVLANAEVPWSPDRRSFRVLMRHLLAQYYSAAERAYGAFACSWFITPYPSSWRSSSSVFYDLHLFWQVLRRAGLAQFVTREPFDNIMDLKEDESWDFGIFREWYRKTCRHANRGGEDVLRILDSAGHKQGHPKNSDLAHALQALQSRASVISQRRRWRGAFNQLTGGASMFPADSPRLPARYSRLEPDVRRFTRDTPYENSVFVMMKFEEPDNLDESANRFLEDLFQVVQSELGRYGLVARRADDKTYATSKQLWDNLCVYMLGCCYGLAIIENYTGEEFNPNVALEYGFMQGLGRETILLMESGVSTVRADLTGTLCKPFEVDSAGAVVRATVQEAIEAWMIDLGRPARRGRRPGN